MQGIGFTTEGKAKQGRAGKPNNQQHEEVTPTSSLKGQRKMIVLLESKCCIQQDLKPWWASLRGTGARDKMQPWREKPPDIEQKGLPTASFSWVVISCWCHQLAKPRWQQNVSEPRNYRLQMSAPTQQRAEQGKREGQI